MVAATVAWMVEHWAAVSAVVTAALMAAWWVGT